MNKLRFLTAGESHGKAVVAILEGMPAGISITPEFINRELKRRMDGYGRSQRMRIENDCVEILGGIRLRKTTGAPICLKVDNLDYPNWVDTMSPEMTAGKETRKTVPYPGHADMAGVLKYGFTGDVRDVTERASARETAARVSVASVCKAFLVQLGVTVFSHVVAIGGESLTRYRNDDLAFLQRAEDSDVRCGSPKVAKLFRKRIDEAAKNHDSVGGVFEVVALGLFPGLGSYVHWDRKISTRLAAAMMSINAVKGVEIGDGFDLAQMPGKKSQDQLVHDKDGSVAWDSNHAGGLEGGVTNGQPLVVRAAMKPISSAVSGLKSFDLEGGEPVKTKMGRSDVCAVPSAAVVAEAMVSLVLADAVLEKFGGDSLAEVIRNKRNYLKSIRTGFSVS